MRTKVIERINAETDDFSFGYMNVDGEWIELKPGEDLSRAAEILGCSEELLAALVDSFGLLQELVGADLRSLWRRMDEAGLEK